MDNKCENCGQTVNDTDKFCKFCGYLLPLEEVEPPNSKQRIDDEILQAKVNITSEQLASASLYDLSKVTVRLVGDKKSIYTKSVMITLLSIIVTIGLFVAAFVIKYAKINDVLAFTLMLFSALAVMSTFGLGAERYMNTKAISLLSEDTITVRKYGFSKPAEFIIGGNIFTLDINAPCASCSGEFVGDLHAERLEKILVAVCNMNRKHYWIIDEENLIKSVKDGSVLTVTKQQQRAKLKMEKLENKKIKK